ncbi:MAG TPA: LytTR family DNA-binding domain-containing protein [Thermoanaerobaculia bacterium]
MMIRALIVEDEPLARSRLRMLLESHEDVELVGESASAQEAAQLFDRETVDLLFLDIQMPQGSGFDLLHVLGEERRPVVIFTTAHAEFALEAFDVSAADYLVKPFDQVRLSRALDRARALMSNGGNGASGAVVTAALINGRPLQRRDRFAVRARGEIVFLKANTVDWIGAEGNYSRLYSGESSYLLRESMQKLDETLDPSVFIRVHRSAIINLDRVKKLIAAPDGSYSIVLSTGASVPLGPSFRPRLETVLGQKL